MTIKKGYVTEIRNKNGQLVDLRLFKHAREIEPWKKFAAGHQFKTITRCVDMPPPKTLYGSIWAAMDSAHILLPSLVTIIGSYCYDHYEKHVFYCLGESGFGTVLYLTLLTHYERIQ